MCLKIPLGLLRKTQQTHRIPFLKSKIFCTLKHIWPQGLEIKDCGLRTIIEVNNLCTVLMMKT